MSNSRDCTRCGRPHWRDAKLCSECSDADARKMMKPIIDRNWKRQFGEHVDPDKCYDPREDKREPRYPPDERKM